MKTILFALPALLGFACASSQPTAQLVSARNTYQRVQQSEASAYTPARVLTAREALERAEKAHSDDPGSFEEQSLAYIAQRQAELAEAYGNIAKSDRDRKAAEVLYKQRQGELRKNAERSLEDTQDDLQSARRDLAAQGAARADAERRLSQAMQTLSNVGNVKTDQRGTVITLDGSVLFASGKSALLPISRTKIESVARAFSNLDPGQVVLVEGHTDSRGEDATNLTLSQQRADSVREQLIQNGIDAARIRAIGRGEQEPVASNDTPEGRANNRRVELVVTWADQAAAAQTRAGASSPASGSGPSGTAPQQGARGASGTLPPASNVSAPRGSGATAP